MGRGGTVNRNLSPWEIALGLGFTVSLLVGVGTCRMLVCDVDSKPSGTEIRNSMTSNHDELRARERQTEEHRRQCLALLETSQAAARAERRETVQQGVLSELAPLKNKCDWLSVTEPVPDIDKIFRAARWKAWSPAERSAALAKLRRECYREDTGTAKCCDGTLSDTCGCRRLRGCCSRHGGVCGCDCPGTAELKGE